MTHNVELQEYLQPYISDAYLRNLENQDYQTLKSLYVSFKGTDLEPKLSEQYNRVRGGLLRDISLALEDYFESEREMLERIEYYVRTKSEEYVQKGTIEITAQLVKKNDRNLVQKIFKHQDKDKYSFSSYAQTMISKHFNPAVITRIVDECLDSFIGEANSYRNDVCFRYLGYNDGTTILPSYYRSEPFEWTIGDEQVSEIQGIKNTSAALSIGSLALGFIPGVGPVAAVADVLDLLNGMTEDERINSLMTQLTATLYSDSLDCIDQYFQTIFSQFDGQRRETAANLMRLINEKF